LKNAATASAPRSSGSEPSFTAAASARYGEQAGHVAPSGRGEERLHQLSICTALVVVGPSGALDPAPGAAGELARRDRRPIHDASDVVERDIEKIVKHEGHALRGREAVQDHHQRDTDGLGGACVLLGIHCGRVILGGTRGVHLRLLAA
jgi:hypothetical protein